MKNLLLISMLLLVFVSPAFSQDCLVAGVKIQTPMCEKPKDASVASVTCSQLTLQWKGGSNETYEVNVTYKDAVSNKVVKTISTINISCDGRGSCSASIPVVEGSKASWSVQAICASEDRTFYSYALRGNDVSIPSCKELSDNSSKTIHVYPNPSTGNITIEYSGGNGNVQFIIYNMMGKIVFNRTQSINNNYRFDLSNLDPGIYLLEARNGNDISQTKFVIEK